MCFNNNRIYGEVKHFSGLKLNAKKCRSLTSKTTKFMNHKNTFFNLHKTICLGMMILKQMVK